MPVPIARRARRPRLLGALAALLLGATSLVVVTASAPPAAAAHRQCPVAYPDVPREAVFPYPYPGAWVNLDPSRPITAVQVRCTGTTVEAQIIRLCGSGSCWSPWATVRQTTEGRAHASWYSWIGSTQMFMVDQSVAGRPHRAYIAVSDAFTGGQTQWAEGVFELWTSCC